MEKDLIYNRSVLLGYQVSHPAAAHNRLLYHLLHTRLQRRILFINGGRRIQLRRFFRTHGKGYALLQDGVAVNGDCQLLIRKAGL